MQKIHYTLSKNHSPELLALLQKVFTLLQLKFSTISFEQTQNAQLVIDLTSNDITADYCKENYYLIKKSPAHQKLSFISDRVSTLPQYEDGFHLSEISYAIQKLFHLDPQLPSVTLLTECQIKADGQWIFTPYLPQNNLQATTEKNSSVSVKRLHQKIQQLDSDLICTDIPADFIEKKQSNRYLFFGSFLDHYLEAPLYAQDKIEINVLGSAAQQTLEALFKIEGIGIIPREDLYPVKESFTSLQKQGVNWVYSGRLTEDKNLSLVILFFYYWQKKYDSQSTLTIFGSIQESSRNYFCSEDQGDFTKKIRELLSQHDWITPPIFMGEYPDSVWTKYIKENSCFINLSTYCKDDFGVSTAQYLQHANNALLSAWGGHLDISGQGIFKVDAELLLTKEISLTEKANILADQFHHYNEQLDSHPVCKKKAQTIYLEQVLHSLKKFKKEFGDVHLFLNRGLSVELSETAEGRRLVQSYSLLFRGIKDGHPLFFASKQQIAKSQWINSNQHIFLDPLSFKLAQKLTKN